MNYVDTANDLLEILANDYSGCQETKEIGNKEKFISDVRDAKSYEEFFSIVTDYILQFKDRHLMPIDTSKQIKYNTFTTRRFENKLFVTDISDESPLEIGQAIIAIDGKNINQIVSENQELFDSVIERQNFNHILNKAKIVTLDSGQNIELVKSLKRNWKSDEFIFKKLDPNTCYLKLENFASEAPIANLIKENKEELNNCRNLIIDVRTNHGGSDIYYFKLLDYIFPKETKLEDIEKSISEKQYYNVTDRNYRLRKEIFEEEFKRHSVSEENQELMNDELSKWSKNIGNGFVELYSDENSDDPFSDYLINGRETPANIVVLSDFYCGSSGDNFVATVKESPKVTVIGRNTMGITDYSDCVAQKYEDFCLFYPTSKMSVVDEGRGINGIGIAPDIHVPWNPEFFEKDLDIEKAFEIFDEK
ncbi:hypothetical protein BG261_10475 [Floricoccus tropicus]|uniref:Tail specific protease domain-containing protein n=1 Tax=Floricoccus tropicus TaxID=1859473 RepID=A0A1E8GP82_9LACT|nr:S41 family peptidase [Floricoccus tropicus]OFI50059.1 hypothetical protein BG261_10475 [Floricoccus tropicus]